MSETVNEVAVLHVDDDESFAELTAAFLEREHDRFRVATETSVAAGLDRLADEEFDCVVSDYDMPSLDGLDFLDAVRENDPELPFILYTGKGSEEVASDAISAGVTDYLQKEHGTSQYTVLANRIENAVEQYRSRSALKASEQRLSLFIEQSPLGVIEYDRDFRIVGVNERAEGILGYSEAELRDRTWEAIVTEDSYENVDTVTDQLATDTGGYHSVDENVRKDGEHIRCEWHNRVVTDDDGEVVAVFSLFQDVTERIEREERLRETTARLTALFEESPDMVNVHNVDGDIIDPNPQLCEATGYSAAELTEMKVWDLDRTLDAERATAIWNDMDKGGRRRVESVYTRKDGSTFPVEVHARRLDLAGEDRFVAISRDVSERVDHEDELERTNALLSTLVGALPVGVLAENSDRTVLAVNDRLLELFDIPGAPANLVDADCRKLAREAGELTTDPVGFVERVDELISESEPVYAESVELENGRTLARSYEPIELPDGTGHLWMYRDTTEQRERERQLQRQNERLSEFASVVSHDLRNPLNVAAGNVQLAREEHDSDRLATAAEALDRIGDLIDDLLTLAREGDDVGDRELVSLSSLVADCWRTVETADADLRNELTVTVVADRSRLQQLVENLVRNSVEHGGPDVTVTVGDLPNGFYVADDGDGIPTDHRDTVFEAGYTTSRSGTGFGLAIVKQVAEAHGWEVRATESAEGGTRFEITGVDFADGRE
ncbi:PAS domain S-box protein [Haloferax sp. KTX1]|uniref:hybrid sensor histidine kinase/response regulator n=1 Tax=Haloferax sp. KTX1 TaxID=2600597 RepID=UPI0011DCF1CF|nr:PAS domain S-box protein [Haloferax sp. KTX1]